MMEVERAHGTISRESIVIQDAKAGLAGGTEIQITGNISIAKQLKAILTADFTNLDTNVVSPVAWRFGGKMSGHLVYKGES